ncbi:hypothetical protein ETD86_52910 [Nonomuraea turkmeniaca]|uniref:Uncharacterized protein n=1 Tax=Nonomuraea turkmeniaca TaxID=103838 RepID=A0A5S4EV33_9ACTN|nr:hypothetical protein [Nonomuraea turkmeniaca]TMR06252.1 hypothetical protein ETD86_52910 [Nonomuraea turkmeniaca]
MVKRLLVATVMAASTLVISGPITSQPANATESTETTDSLCTGAQQSAAPGSAAVKCRYKTIYGDWCKQCYRNGKWRTEFCSDPDEEEDEE